MPIFALVTDYEVGIRVGLIRHATYPVYPASGSWGTAAGTAASGFWNSAPIGCIMFMGGAEYHAPIAPMMKGIDTASIDKDGVVRGCMTAVLASIMAR